MGEIIQFSDLQEKHMTVREWFRLHPEDLERVEREMEEDCKYFAELGRTDPEYSDYTKYEDAKIHRAFIGDKDESEMTEFERRLIEKDEKELEEADKRVMQKFCETFGSVTERPGNKNTHKSKF